MVAFARHASSMVASTVTLVTLKSVPLMTMSISVAFTAIVAFVTLLRVTFVRRVANKMHVSISETLVEFDASSVTFVPLVEFAIAPRSRAMRVAHPPGTSVVTLKLALVLLIELAPTTVQTHVPFVIFRASVPFVMLKSIEGVGGGSVASVAPAPPATPVTLITLVTFIATVAAHGHAFSTIGSGGGSGHHEGGGGSEGGSKGGGAKGGGERRAAT